MLYEDLPDIQMRELLMEIIAIIDQQINKQRIYFLHFLYPLEYRGYRWIFQGIFESINMYRKYTYLDADTGKVPFILDGMEKALVVDALEHGYPTVSPEYRAVDKGTRLSLNTGN